MKVLTKNAKVKQIKIVNSDLKDVEQRDSSAICGQLVRLVTRSERNGDTCCVKDLENYFPVIFLSALIYY